MVSILCVLAVLTLLAWFAADLTAQQASAHRGLFLGFQGRGSPSVSAVGQVSPTNTWAAWPTSPTGPWRYWGDAISATQDVDNHGVIVPAYDGNAGSKPLRYSFLVWDPVTQAVVSTIWTGTFGAAGTPQTLTNMTLDSDGDLHAYDMFLDHYFEFDRLNRTWASIAGPFRRFWGGMGGLEWDRLHGGFLIAAGQSMYEQSLCRLHCDLGAYQVVAAGSTNLRAFSGGAVLEDGEWVFSYMTGGTYMIVKSSTARWEHGPMTFWGAFSDCTAEKFAAPGRADYAAFGGGWSIANRGVAYVDATTTPHTIVGLVAGPYPRGVLSAAVTEVLPLHERDLCTVRTGKATWVVKINPAQRGLSGHRYVLLASLTGATPPIRLPDGRQIFLCPDGLTHATVNGPLPPILTGNIGNLDARGATTSRLDLSALGTAANRTVIHFCALVFAHAAPSGVALGGGIPGILTYTVGTRDSHGNGGTRVDLTQVGPALRGMRIVATAVILDRTAPSGVAQFSEAADSPCVSPLPGPVRVHRRGIGGHAVSTGPR